MTDVFSEEKRVLPPNIINLTINESRGVGLQAENFINVWGSGEVACVELDINPKKDQLKSIALISKDGTRHDLSVKLIWNGFNDVELEGRLEMPRKLVFRTEGGKNKEIGPNTTLEELKETFGNMVVGGKKLNNDFAVSVKQTAEETP